MNSNQQFAGPPPQQPPWWANERTVIQILAIFGAVITIVGAGYLVSLVADLSFITPLMRVLAATVLGFVFLGFALLLHMRGTLPVVTSGVLVTAAATLALVIYSMIAIYKWWPGWLGAAAFTLLVACFFGIGRLWKAPITTILLGYMFLAFLTQYQTFAPEFLPLPGTMIGVLLIALTSFGQYWDTTRLHACVILALGLVMAEMPFSPAAFPGEIWALVFAAALILLTHWDRGMLTTTYLACGGIAPAILIFVACPLWDDTRLSGWAAFALCVAWVALTQFVRPRPDTAKLQLFAWSVTPLPLLMLLVNDFDQPFPIWVFLPSCIIFFVWFARNKSALTPLVCWALAMLFLTGPLTLSALSHNDGFFSARMEAMLAVAILASLTGCVWALRNPAPLPTPARIGLFALSLHAFMISFVPLAKALGGNLAFEYSHVFVTVLWLTIGALVLTGFTKLKHPTDIKLAILFIAASTLKVFELDYPILPLLPRSLVFLLCGIILLIAVARRSSSSRKPKPVPAAEEAPTPPAAAVSELSRQ